MVPSKCPQGEGFYLADAGASLLRVSSELLLIQDLSLTIAGRALLSSISLSLKPRARICIVGPNGAGKTSLLRVIAGLCKGSSGTALLQGREISDYTPDGLAQIVGFVPQRLEYLPAFSVSEFLELSGYARQDVVLRLTQHLLFRYLPELSAGELQRVLLAGALAQGVKLLLLDEPTSNLDPTGKTEVEQVLRELVDEDLALLIVTHDISLALRTAQQIVIMSQGTISWSGDTCEESMLSELERGYQCSFMRIDHPDLQGPVIVAR